MENKFFLFSLIALTFAQNFNFINCVTIKTKSGSVNGVAVTFDNKVINKFLGIPYAEPPVGSNRFAQTKPVHAWNGTYDATHFKNVCYQKASGLKMSEDCLYLNIYSEERKSGDNKLHPVMFWIHGGGLTEGDGYGFDGTVLSSKGVVFVSINYRLGPFGFLYGGDSSAPGNVGILDQIMALHWVKDNIEAFGGDPNQVTIFGFSAGGWSVSTLIVSPLAKNLFKRAIIQSGAYFAKPIMDSNKDNHLATAKKMSESIGCAHDNKWLDCLRNASADQIIKHIFANALTYGGESGVVPNGIEEALKLKKVNTGIELMTGTTNAEAIGWAVGIYPKIKDTSAHITKEEIKAKILSSYGSNPKFGQSLYDFYISHLDEKNQSAIRQSVAALVSDELLLCPTYYFAKWFARLSATDKTYFYTTTYKSKQTSCGQDWMGVCHGDDMPFIVGTPITNKSSFNATDYEFSLMITQMWTDFAKTGNPLFHSVTNKMGTEVKTWPMFVDANTASYTPKVMELNPYRFGHVLNDPYHGSCDLTLSSQYE